MQVVQYKGGSILEEFLSIEKLVPNPFIIVDEAHKIVYANQLALEAFGYSYQVLVAKSLSSIIRFEFPAPSLGSQSARCLGRRKNKEQVALNISFRAITENFVNHWCISISELTPSRVEMAPATDQERELEELRDELDNRLKELEIFSYAVAHDLQAPLRGIDGYTNLFIKTYFDQLEDQGKRLLTRVSENVNKMQLQLHELDYLLKLGMVELHFSEINMHEVAVSVVKELKLYHLIQITIHKGIRVVGDVRLIKEVLTKLISNAIKFSPEDVHFKIEIGCINQKGEYHFFVKDFGVGFDEEYNEVVFGVFQQLHDPELYPGIGLSLATVKQIVSRHGGDVWAMGKENEGATFYFTLHSKMKSNGDH